MKKRAIILVIDSLGIGSMEDFATYRPNDAKANTFASILNNAKYINIQNLETLGINKIINHKSLKKIEPIASYGKLNLMHQGADSYLGHQEIMGSKPLKPLVQPFKTIINEMKKIFIENGHVAEIVNQPNPVLLVDKLIIVADNIETDFGQIYNVTAPLDYIDFEALKKVGQIVRDNVKVSRVITLGGTNIGIENLISAIETTKQGVTGINCPKSGVYKQGYMVKHQGYGIDPKSQVSSIFKRANLEVTLIGKMADVIDCQGANYITAIETDKVMYELLNTLKNSQDGLISATVQETDLSGHQQDIDRYANKICTVDAYLKSVIENMTQQDILFITADHGNDPTIGHPQHTREKTFMLMYSKSMPAKDVGERATLSDISATVCDYFGVQKCENGTSMLND